MVTIKVVEVVVVVVVLCVQFVVQTFCFKNVFTMAFSILQL